jgi:hypothetical protein
MSEQGLQFFNKWVALSAILLTSTYGWGRCLQAATEVGKFLTKWWRSGDKNTAQLCAKSHLFRR